MFSEGVQRTTAVNTRAHIHAILKAHDSGHTSSCMAGAEVEYEMCNYKAHTVMIWRLNISTALGTSHHCGGGAERGDMRATWAPVWEGTAGWRCSRHVRGPKPNIHEKAEGGGGLSMERRQMESQYNAFHSRRPKAFKLVHGWFIINKLIKNKINMLIKMHSMIFIRP